MDQTDLISYLKREMTAAVEEVQAEVDSGSLVDDVSDAEISEAGNGTPVVDSDDEDSDDDWEFSPKSNPDDDEEYLKALDIDTDFLEDRYSRKRHQRMLIDMRQVDFMPTIEEESEEGEPEEKRGEWWSGFDWAEECEWLSGFSWAEECEKE